MKKEMKHTLKQQANTSNTIMHHTPTTTQCLQFLKEDEDNTTHHQWEKALMVAISE